MDNMMMKAFFSFSHKICLCYSIIFFFGTGANFLLGQKTFSVSNIRGSALISGDVSPNLAKKQALNDAKINALKSAGIREHLSSYQVLFTSQQKNDYSQFFVSDIQNELQGAVQSYELKTEKTYCKNEFEIIYEITIDAVIIKYESRPDAAFEVSIEGVKKVYNNDEPLKFNVKTSQISYLTVFNITDTEALLLFPNKYEKQGQCKPLEVCKYPVAKIDYILHTDKNGTETNRLIFVFTKIPVPFIRMNEEQVTSNENIFSWIYSIMPDQRKVEYLTLSIQK
jgi:hypothetical protein